MDLRPTELALIKTADVDLATRYMKGGIKTKAGKNRLIPKAEKIFPPLYDGWMKNPKSALLSCNDGFRPVSFLIETLDEDAD